MRKTRPTVASFEWKKGVTGKHSRWPLKARKNKETDSLPVPPERHTAQPTL